jgi:DNA-binding transcriptional ArsR family regulator
MDEDEADELLRALAHPARRQILRNCWSGPVSAGRLTATLDLAPASVSEHLRVLRKTGLVVLTKSGTFRHYQTNVARVAALSRWLGAFPSEGDTHGLPDPPL